MAVSFVTHHTSANSKTDGTTISATLASNVASGNTLIAWVFFDNTSTTDPTVSSISVESGESASWTLLKGFVAPSSNAGASVRGELWGIVTTQQWNSSLSVTATLSASVTAKGILLAEFSGASLTIDNSASFSQVATQSPNAGIIGLDAGDLVLGAAAWEATGTVTGDPDTDGGSWSTVVQEGTSGQGGASNITGCFQYKVLSSGVNQNYSPALSSTDSGMVIVALNPGSTGQSVNIGLNTETDSVTAVTKIDPIHVAVGLITETDSTFAVTKIDPIHQAVGLISETDEAFAHTATKSYNIDVGLVTETDEAFAVTKIDPIHQAVGLVTETDETFAVTKVDPIWANVGLVTETDTPQAVTAVDPIWVNVGLVTEADETFAVTKVDPIHAAVGLVTETDETFAVTAVDPIWVNVGLVTETDEPFAITVFQPGTPIGLVTETDAAQAHTSSKALAVGLVTETDSVTALGVVDPIHVPVGLVTEAGEAFAHTVTKALATGGATETDSPFAVTKIDPIWVPVNVAQESGAALALTLDGFKITNHSLTLAGVVKSLAVGLVTETDEVLGVGDARAVGLAAESDATFAVTVHLNRLVAVGLVTETDEAPAVSPPTLVNVGLVTETDEALVPTRQYGVHPALLVETDTAQAVTRVKPIPVGVATETDVEPLAFTLYKGHTLAVLSETDEAPKAGTGKSVGSITENESAFPVTVELQGTHVLQVSEADTAQPIALVENKNKPVGLVTAAADELPEMWVRKSHTLATLAESDTPQTVGVSKVKTLGLVTTATTAQVIRPTRFRAVAQVAETDEVTGVTALRSRVLGATTETATAQSVGKVRAYAIPLVTESDTPGQFGTTIAVDYRNPSGHTRATATSRARGASATIGAASTAATTKAASNGTAAGASINNTTGAEIL